MLTTGTYLIYLLLSIGITINVGKQLSTNGLIFLVHHLKDNQELANAINKLLLIGFYLINIGYILLVLNLNLGISPGFVFAAASVDSLNTLIRFLSINLGLVLLMLGTMHLLLFYVISQWKPKLAVDASEVQ